MGYNDNYLKINMHMGIYILNYDLEVFISKVRSLVRSFWSFRGWELWIIQSLISLLFINSISPSPSGIRMQDSQGEEFLIIGTRKSRDLLCKCFSLYSLTSRLQSIFEIIAYVAAFAHSFNRCAWMPYFVSNDAMLNAGGDAEVK